MLFELGNVPQKDVFAEVTISRADERHVEGPQQLVRVLRVEKRVGGFLGPRAGISRVPRFQRRLAETLEIDQEVTVSSQVTDVIAVRLVGVEIIEVAPELGGGLLDVAEVRLRQLTAKFGTHELEVPVVAGQEERGRETMPFLADAHIVMRLFGIFGLKASARLRKLFVVVCTKTLLLPHGSWEDG